LFFGLSLKGLQVILDASKLSPWLALKLDNHIQISVDDNLTNKNKSINQPS